MLIVPKAVKSYRKKVRYKSRLTFLCDFLETFFTFINIQYVRLEISAESCKAIRVVCTLFLSEFNQNCNMSTASSTILLSLKYIIS
jgi:hypothetical protein